MTGRRCARCAGAAVPSRAFDDRACCQVRSVLVDNRAYLEQLERERGAPNVLLCSYCNAHHPFSVTDLEAL